MPNNNEEPLGHSFGTFSGVFTPSILTIFGLIMFMRTCYVIGYAGIAYALGILAIAKLITFATGLSISAISTNTPVKGGGAYFLISRALGPGFGSAIGLALFVAQALSVPFYIFGFSEAFVKNMALPPEYYLWICLGTGALIFIITWVGADWVIKFQYFILAILGVAILTFLFGAAQTFTLDQFYKNMQPAYTDGYTNTPDLTTLFAIFFPAVTGIMAGVNMSGDLKDPAKSIPTGTLWAIFLSFVMYSLQMIITGGAFPREELIQHPYMVLVNHAVFGLGFLVSMGVYAATLSSALGSFMGSPRVLQALALDKILNWLNPFGKGEGTHNEPKRALLFTGIISFIILYVGGKEGIADGDGGGFLNMIAEIVTMFFLYTYGIVNLAAFVESFGANPSFRPRFKYYHWGTALFGALGCIFTSFLINFTASLIALIIISILYFIASRADMEKTFGDARRGFIFSRIRSGLIMLKKMPFDLKNWRPTILVLTSRKNHNYSLLKYGTMFECNKGILSVVSFLDGDLEKVKPERNNELSRLNTYAKENNLEIFPEVIASTDFDVALDVFLQGHSIGPIKPNIVMTAWPKVEFANRLAKHIRVLRKLSLSSVIMFNKDEIVVPNDNRKRIDIWWRGRSNGSLMLILAYLLCLNPQWKGVKIRIIRIIPDAGEYTESLEEMQGLIDAARIAADIKTIVSAEDFPTIYKRESQDALLTFLGYLPPKDEDAVKVFEFIEKMQQEMPPAFYVTSSGDTDILV
jgi:amino acid transporter